MPLFAWPINGSVSDINTLENTLDMLSKLGYKPDCLMQDRGFSSMGNITAMFIKKYTFLQTLKTNPS
jgi:transposase